MGSLPRAHATAAAQTATATSRKDPPIARPPGPHTGPHPFASRGPRVRPRAIACSLPAFHASRPRMGNTVPTAGNAFAHPEALWYRGPVKIDVPSGARAVPGNQTRILREALQAIRPERPAAAFDLDSTILSNKPRQARIVREFGRARGIAALSKCGPEAVVSWDLRDTMRLCGLSADEAERLDADVRRFWFERFFTSEYCKEDEPIPGAADYLQRVLRAGGQILYITGRHTGMEAGTLEAFRRARFPMPDRDQVQLWLKPSLEDDDDRWKEVCHARLLGMSGVASAFDNEPMHVNAYKRAFPDAVVVHLDTDHSGRPVEVRPDVPSILDFRMTE